MKQQRILRYLPENYQLAAAGEGGVMHATLAVIEGMLDPVDELIRALDTYFDPYRAKDAFVLLQATWLGLDRYFDWSGGSPGVGEARYPAGIDRLRMLIAEFPQLVRSRGTHQSLIRFLEVATGLSGFTVEDGNQTGEAFHIIVRVPANAAQLDGLISRIVAGERPAHATWEIQPMADGPGKKKE